MVKFLLRAGCRINFSESRQGNYLIECTSDARVCPKKKNRGIFKEDCLSDSPPSINKWGKPLREWLDEELKDEALDLNKSIHTIECFSIKDVSNYHLILSELSKRGIKFRETTRLEFVDC